MAKKNTRDVLLDYTYKELEKYGYFQASTTEILKKCKIPKGSMYHYFSSKHELTLAVINERVKVKTLKLFEITSTDAPMKSLIDFIQEIDFDKKYFKYDLLFHRLYTEMASHDEEFKNVLDDIYSLLIDNIEINIKKSIDLKQINKIDTYLLASFILSSIFGFISMKDDSAKRYLVDYLNKMLIIKKVIKKEKKSIKQHPTQGSLF